MLTSAIRQMDHRGYPNLKSLKGAFDMGAFILHITHVQGDPFASPSTLAVTVANTFPEEYFSVLHRKTALEDFLLRRFSASLEQYAFRAKGSGKSGLLSVTHPGPEILRRTALEVSKTGITARFTAGFPAKGRSISGEALIKMLTVFIPAAVSATLFFASADKTALKAAIDLSDDQTALRAQAGAAGLVSFICDGSLLPRKSGISKAPLTGAIPFSSPDTLKYTFHLPHHGTITGLGIKKGITLIVGGGYHGKSTLLDAIKMGVYNHTASDGRAFVVTDPSAVLLRAEDGRSIAHTDISLFINNLPNGKDTKTFSTPDASGSTSQAAGVIEAYEAGSQLLLIDEDTSATNFMVRDRLMQEIVSKDKEPITPFTIRARALCEKLHMSTVLVAGSSGAYFAIADTVIQMDTYVPKDITAKVKAHLSDLKTPDAPVQDFPMPEINRPLPILPESRNRKDGKLRTDGTDGFSIGRATCDLRLVSQIPDAETVNAIAFLVQNVLTKKPASTIRSASLLLEQELEKNGFSRLIKDVPGNFAFPRRQEIVAALGRIRI